MAKKFFICLVTMAVAATAAIPLAMAGGELAEKQVLYFASPGRDIRAVDPAYAVSSIELFIKEAYG